MNEARKLPLWRDTLEQMEPIHFGKMWSRSWLEEKLGAQAGELKFAAGLMAINEAIRSRGFKLTQRGNKGRAWHVLPESAIEDELRREQAAARRCFQRAVELGTGLLANEQATLTDAQVRSLDHQVRTAAARLALTARRNVLKGLPGEKLLPAKTRPAKAPADSATMDGARRTNC